MYLIGLLNSSSFFLVVEIDSPVCQTVKNEEGKRKFKKKQPALTKKNLMVNEWCLNGSVNGKWYFNGRVCMVNAVSVVELYG